MIVRYPSAHEKQCKTIGALAVVFGRRFVRARPCCQARASPSPRRGDRCAGFWKTLVTHSFLTCGYRHLNLIRVLSVLTASRQGPGKHCCDLPKSWPPSPGCGSRRAPRETLLGQDAELDLCDVEPAAVFRGVWDVEAVQESTGLLRRNRRGVQEEFLQARVVLRNVHPPVGAAELRRDGDHLHVEHVVSAPQRIARIFQYAAVTDQRGFGGFGCRNRLGYNR
jgi:hypothetical protein